MVKMLDSKKPNSIFLDIGANIGVHTVYMAARGFKVWSAEPITTNILKMWQSAILSECLENIRLFKNTVDMQRGLENKMAVDGENIGASQVIMPNESHNGIFEVSKSVLLKDLIEDMITYEQPKQVIDVILKIDIEHHECRAFLGSKEIFKDQRFDIPYIVMEWKFALRQKDKTLKYPESCPLNMLRDLTQLLVSSGYAAFDMAGKKLDTSQSYRWGLVNLVWQHESTPNIFQF